MTSNVYLLIKVNNTSAEIAAYSTFALSNVYIKNL